VYHHILTIVEYLRLAYQSNASVKQWLQ
jgi:hypothetical protein